MRGRAWAGPGREAGGDELGDGCLQLKGAVSAQRCAVTSFRGLVSRELGMEHEEGEEEAWPQLPLFRSTARTRW